MNIHQPLPHLSLSPSSARQLSHPTISAPMMEERSPRWLLRFLPWVSVEAGVYRLNKRKSCCVDMEPDSAPSPHQVCNEDGEQAVLLLSCHHGEPDLPCTFPDYEPCPREYHLNLIQTLLRVHTRVSDIFNSPMNQFQEQLRLTVEAMLEQKEWEILNHPEFGLLHNTAPKMCMPTIQGPPTPDDLDELLSHVWKKPAFFLAHPRAIAAFGRECTRRGVPPAIVTIEGSPFVTWRGVPLVPTDKMPLSSRTERCSRASTKILLLRVGEAEQGVIGLHQTGIPDEQYHPGLSVKFCGIDQKSIAHYLLSLYFSVAVMTNDALGMLEQVEVDHYDDPM